MKHYQIPNMEIISFDMTDILTVSTTKSGAGDDWDVGAELKKP